ncbi:extensin-like protein [Myxococcus sp. CA040A]|uniref:extensin-like protein n=1 Tax=Myxococcus sp. CA040A TaxID=2741738 RepID=UPI00157B053A|nr:extensin-like protein [Myxococcus sp. CA040A]NTX06575.1 extensin-like protein [Myxococcus sp. CA040A]
MKKAFEQNVSRAKPRLRLGAFTGVADPGESAPSEQEPAASAPPEPPSADLSAEVRARIERARAPRPTAAEAMEVALGSQEAPRAREPVFTSQVSEPVTYASPEPESARFEDESGEVPVTFAAPPAVAFHLDGFAAGHSQEAHSMTQGSSHASLPHVTAMVAEPVARVEAPPQEMEVQTPAPPREEPVDDSEARRERLKARLKAVRENPRPEPLPATVAEAGQRAVERITHLQAELVKVKAANLSLTQELEVARRQAEKATEEARLRMDEARRLSSEMEGRVKLLADLERELAALEGERDEALLSLQENRQALQASAKEHEALEEAVSRGKQALVDSLAEEERLAGELESAKDESTSLRRAVEALQGERDVLAQQVASLTAERAELLEARKALESVHRALSQAVAR